MLGWIRRRRTSSGFGVHSPFAFRFIRGVLREDAPYYGFPELDALASDGEERRRLRLLVRIVDSLRPPVVIIPPCGRRAPLVRAVAVADSRIPVLFGLPVRVPEGALLLDPPSAADAAPVFAAGGSVVCFGEPLPGLFDAMDCGMTFAGRSAVVAVGRRDLPRQDFKLNF